MPARDVRPIVSRYRRGSYSRGGGNYYDDEGRGASRDLWEWFQEYFNSEPTLEHLLDIDDRMCYQCLSRSVSRYGLVDIAYMWEPGWKPGQDTRAHKLVLSKLPESDWVLFHLHLVEGYKRHVAALELELHERAERQNAEYAAYQIRAEAERIELARRDQEIVQKVVDITEGTLQAELDKVFVFDDKVGNYGDWIEDVVDTYQDGSGFGCEVDKATGIKLQITLNLDLSNSMFYNGVHQIAAIVYRDLGLALKALKVQYSDLYVGFFTFSEDGWEGKGKKVCRLEVKNPKEDDYFQEFRDYRPSVIERWYREGKFTGTDTWLSPLFQHIEEWERENSDPGAMKLDILITDAVVEHKKDIREADVIQERRDGSLQSVFLNFLKPKDAINSTLPKHCFQVFVDKDNVSGILRNVISEFVGAYL